MITEEERAEAAREYEAQYAAQLPATEEAVSRWAALFSAITLRKARDRTRAERQPTSSGPRGGYADDRPDVRSGDVGGLGAGQRRAGQRRAGSQ